MEEAKPTESVAGKKSCSDCAKEFLFGRTFLIDGAVTCFCRKCAKNIVTIPLGNLLVFCDFCLVAVNCVSFLLILHKIDSRTNDGAQCLRAMLRNIHRCFCLETAYEESAQFAETGVSVFEM